MSNFDFPVSLQNVYTHNGAQVPRIRAVFREDTQEPIAAVTDRYKLFTHKEVMDRARGFVSQLGEPKASFHLTKNGKILTGEYTYTDKTLATTTGDMVGMRVYIQNAYDATKSLSFRIGAMVLKCMNGMMVAKDAFHIVRRHTGDSEIEFPSPEEVLHHFHDRGRIWDAYSKMSLTDSEYRNHLDKAIETGVINHNVLKAPTEGNRVWDMYNQFTYHITHNESKNASPLGKMARLDKTDRWFKETFAH